MENFPSITYVPINTDLVLNLMSAYKDNPDYDTVPKAVQKALEFAADNAPLGVLDF